NRCKEVHDVVTTANSQTSGIGLHSNQSLSPQGCAMFTLNLNLSLSGVLMKRISFIQHLASLSIILSLPSQELGIKIKWPNDILYAESMSKLAGILVRSFCHGDSVNVQIGFGINKSNRQPSVCLHEII